MNVGFDDENRGIGGGARCFVFGFTLSNLFSSPKSSSLSLSFWLNQIILDIEIEFSY